MAERCKHCGRLTMSNGLTSLGRQKYKTVCGSCRNARKKGIEVVKKNYCERCGFVPEHPCQLDIDHIDGNSGNNKEDNMQTLCSNCHRLKTVQEKDWQSPSIRITGDRDGFQLEIDF